MKVLTATAAILLSIFSLLLSAQIAIHSKQNQLHKTMYAELNHVKYGIFSVNGWKNQLLDVIKKEFDKLYVSKETEDEMRERISTVMSKLIDELAEKIKKENQKSASGKIKQMFINMFVDVESLKKGIPEYTETVIAELKKSKTKRKVRAVVINQLEEFATKSTDLQGEEELHNMVHATGSTDVESARKKVSEEIMRGQKIVEREVFTLISLTLLSFLMLWLNRKRRATIPFLLFLLSLTLLLWVGVATPMIDIEAKISAVKFLLIGHPIVFENQVFYFQSKSILDVFLIMINDTSIPMKVVGLLVVTFSIIFPVIKMLSSSVYYFNAKDLSRNSVIDFFVFKSGKWSMADVLVVAIFMAYIGFNGIIGNQLAELASRNNEMNVITTNGTSLQPGFYVFLTFVILAMLLSQIISKQKGKVCLNEPPLENT